MKLKDGPTHAVGCSEAVPKIWDSYPRNNRKPVPCCPKGQAFYSISLFFSFKILTFYLEI